MARLKKPARYSPVERFLTYASRHPWHVTDMRPLHTGKGARGVAMFDFIRMNDDGICGIIVEHPSRPDPMVGLIESARLLRKTGGFKEWLRFGCKIEIWSFVARKSSRTRSSAVWQPFVYEVGTRSVRATKYHGWYEKEGVDTAVVDRPWSEVISGRRPNSRSAHLEIRYDPVPEDGGLPGEELLADLGGQAGPESEEVGQRCGSGGDDPPGPGGVPGAGAGETAEVQPSGLVDADGAVPP